MQSSPNLFGKKNCLFFVSSKKLLIFRLYLLNLFHYFCTRVMPSSTGMFFTTASWPMPRRSNTSIGKRNKTWKSGSVNMLLNWQLKTWVFYNPYNSVPSKNQLFLENFFQPCSIKFAFSYKHLLKFFFILIVKIKENFISFRNIFLKNV